LLDRLAVGLGAARLPAEAAQARQRDPLAGRGAEEDRGRRQIAEKWYHPTHLASRGTLPIEGREGRQALRPPPPRWGRWREAPEGVFALRASGLKSQRQAVDAVPQAGRWRAVGEHMAEMAAAIGAVHFGARHAPA